MTTALVCFQACATRPQAPPSSPPRPPQTGSASATEPPSTAEKPPESLRRLASSVDALASRSGDLRPAGIVRALRDLADALALTPGGLRLTPIQLRDVARRLEASPPSSVTHADAVTEALTLALRSLVVRTPPPERKRAYVDRVATIRRSIDALDRSLPLLEQQRAVAAAFRAVADAVFLARGLEPPFGEAEAAGRELAAGSVEDELEEARADLLALGRSRWPTVRWTAARLLSSIADIIEASDPGGAQANRISKIRFQAERLRSTDSLIFVEAEWVKIGLTTALDALDALQDDRRANQRAIVTPWTRAARGAVTTIEGDGSLSFQRAAVQDSFRATVDAFAAALQSGGGCR